MPQSEFQVIPLRAFRDNYVWTLRNARYAAVVDPGEAQPVLDYLAAEKLRPLPAVDAQNSIRQGKQFAIKSCNR